MNTAWKTVFDRLATTYAPLARYSPRCMEICVSIFARSVVEPNPLILDLGCGTGYPAAELVRQAPSSRLVLFDISLEMLREARLEWRARTTIPHWLVGDAQSLPFKSAQFDAVFASCSIQLMSDRSGLFSELKRVLKPRGLFFIITYDPKDLPRQLYNRFFPKYSEYDVSAHLPLTTLKMQLKLAGFRVLPVRKIPYETTFASREELITFVESKPFSTFWRFSPSEFTAGLREFENAVTRALPSNNIINGCVLTCISARSEG